MTYLKGAIIVIVLLFLVTFGVKNSQPVQLNYYFGLSNLEIPLYGLVYLSLLIGIFVGMGVGLFKRIQLGRTVKKLHREMSELPTKEEQVEAKQAVITEKTPIAVTEEEKEAA